MPVYNAPNAGTKVYRTKIKFRPRKLFNLTYGEVFPTVCKFVLPGDVWKISANALIRYKPTLAPVLTECNAFHRFFFVPLRQVVEDIEKIITGSENGSLIGTSLPTCNNFVKEYLSVHMPTGLTDHCVVHKNSFWAAMGVMPNRIVTALGNTSYQNYDADADTTEFPAAYVYKAYCRIIWDYFRDENYQAFDGDFDKFYEYMLSDEHESDVQSNAWYVANTWYELFQGGTTTEEKYGVNFFKLWFCDLRKDYFTSSLPWIMKGVQPTINSVMHADFTSAFTTTDSETLGTLVGAIKKGDDWYLGSGAANGDPSFLDPSTVTSIRNKHAIDGFNRNQITDGGFSAQDVRDMFAETRVFERLARCGSRYVEYLEANFGIAPRDDTLQRPLYLGGFSQPIVTTEVVQTGTDSSNPVGTLRGHGISSAGNKIKPFVATEFGLIFGLMYVTPKTQYRYQMKRELSYKSRFDFMNPSFQNLSEQQVSSLEFTIPIADHDTTETGTDWVKFKPVKKSVLGYQGMYNELRYDSDIICRDLADTENYWTQEIVPLTISNALPLNGANICTMTYLNGFLKPFNGLYSFKPMVVDFGLNATVYRPLVRDPVPGLVDHN